MTSPAIELQRAIHKALRTDAVLVAALGGAKIYDTTPPNAVFPYISFGRTSMFDWSTGTEIGTEQLFTVHIWSKARGKSEAIEIMERVLQLLSTDTLTLPSFALVNLTNEFGEARYDNDVMVHHAILRYRAVMEPN
jgi:hypothetical protein